VVGGWAGWVGFWGGWSGCGDWGVLGWGWGWQGGLCVEADALDVEQLFETWDHSLQLLLPLKLPNLNRLLPLLQSLPTPLQFRLPLLLKQSRILNIPLLLQHSLVHTIPTKYMALGTRLRPGCRFEADRAVVAGLECVLGDPVRDCAVDPFQHLPLAVGEYVAGGVVLGMLAHTYHNTRINTNDQPRKRSSLSLCWRDW
jgi:hypothetical protein